MSARSTVTISASSRWYPSARRPVTRNDSVSLAGAVTVVIGVTADPRRRPGVRTSLPQSSTRQLLGAGLRIDAGGGEGVGFEHVRQGPAQHLASMGEAGSHHGEQTVG